jgi:DNA polymerase-3 subunit epsilon
MHPGQKNNLDALCKRYAIDNSQRALHGALLDAEILADVYLAMTGGQGDLTLDAAEEAVTQTPDSVEIRVNRANLVVVRADAAELDAHLRVLDILRKTGKGQCAWDRLDQSGKSEA